MDGLKSNNQNDDVSEEEFEDAFDDFPFFDCQELFAEQTESDDDVSPSPSSLSPYSKPLTLDKLSAANLRRRRFTSRNDSRGRSSSVSFEKMYGTSSEGVVGLSDKLKESGEGNARFSKNSESCDENKLNLSSENVEISGSKGFDEESGSFSRISENLDGIELNLSSENVENGQSEGFDQQNRETSIVTCLNNEKIGEFSEGNSNFSETQEEDSSLLLALAGLVIKAIGFQFNLLINFVTFPVWAIYSCYMFIMDPFRVIKRGREYLFQKALGIWGSMFGNLTAFVYEWFKEHQSLLSLVVKFGWGILWSVYVCTVLVGLLVSAFVVAGLLMNVLVEKPIKIRENLNFDFTEKSPSAFVPIIGCPGKDCSVECVDDVKFGGGRVISVYHKLHVTVSLRLPESDYNRNLGIFQVRVDFLAPDGKILASSRQPCMLQFRSDAIRLLLTLLKVGPLLTGYTSESQDLNIKFRGFIEGVRPTSCLRVTIEQRTQFAPGAGIPETYAASLTLESELPLVKRIVWYWKRTLFIWVSLTVFMLELLLTLICCKSIIIPRVRLGPNSASNGASRNDAPLRR